MLLKNLIVIGSSAGGPRILKTIFADFPRINGSIVLVQHMPKFVNDSLVDSIGRTTQMTVKLAENGEILDKGMVYVAPSEVHLELLTNSRIRLYNDEKVNFVCPAIDVTMKSVVKNNNTMLISVILTGMGSDGAQGLAHMKSIGATTIAQNEDTCAVFGMPAEAIKTGFVDFILSPEEIRDMLIEIID